MTEESRLTLDSLNREVEKIGSLLSSVSVQISGIRARVADLELWGSLSGVANGSDTTAAGKRESGDKSPGKRPDGRPGKGKDEQGKGKQGKGKQGKGKQGKGKQGKGKQGKGKRIKRGRSGR